MIYKTNEAFVLRKIGTIWMIVDVRNNKLYELNETAAESYRLFQQSLSEEDVIHALSKKYGQPLSAVRADIEVFINSLLEIGALSRPDGSQVPRTSQPNALQARNFDYYVRNVWKEQQFPYKVKSFELTPRCNFWCYHCYQGNFRLSEQILSLENIKMILDKMAQVGVLEIVLAGGEPLSRPDFKEIYSYAKKLGLLVRVFTNGSLLDDSLISLFKELPPEKLIVSIYGMSEETYVRTTRRSGMYNKVMKNLENVVNAGIPLSLKFIVSKLTLCDFDAVCQYAKDKKAELRYAFYIYPTNEKDESVCDYMLDVRDMLQIDIRWQSDFNSKLAVKKNPWPVFYKKNNYVPQYLCDFPHNQFYVDFTGQVFACSAGMKAIGGNILSNDFNTIWQNFLDVRKTPMTAPNECVGCDALYYCINCPSDEFSFHGDAELINRKMCLFAKAKKLYYSDHLSFEKIAELLKL